MIEIKKNLDDSAQELSQYFSSRLYDSIIKLVSKNLENINKRIKEASKTSDLRIMNKQQTSASFLNSMMSKRNNFLHLFEKKEDKHLSNTPFIKSIIYLMAPVVVTEPSIDKIQNCITNIVHLVINEGNKIIDSNIVKENKEVAYLSTYLSNCITMIRHDVNVSLNHFNKKYEHIWLLKPEAELNNFLSSISKPQSKEFEKQFEIFDNLINSLEDDVDFINVSIISFFTESLKLEITNQIYAWKRCYGKKCAEIYIKEMNYIFNLIDDISEQLHHEINSFEDARLVMNCLRRLRETNNEIDQSIPPVRECFIMLRRHNIELQKSDIEKCDSLQRKWNDLQDFSEAKSKQLIKIQAKYKEELRNNIQVLIQECNEYNHDYDTNGPTKIGLQPMDACVRLSKFQDRFDVIYKKYLTYSDGQELFGLKATEYPRILELKNELNQLKRLYSLYDNIISSISGYYELLWIDINIENIKNEVVDLQTKQVFFNLIIVGI
jgi:dynein heavy chain, axonemal